MENLIKKAQADKDILALILFGSHARGEARPDSDMDICVVLFPEVYNPQKAFDLMVNLTYDENIDVAIYQKMPLYIRQRVLKEGKVLYCIQEEQLYEIACQTITEYADYEHLYHEYLEEVARG